MRNKLWQIIPFSLIAFVTQLSSQCNLTIQGNVFDTSTESPLAYANVLDKESLRGAVTDSLGRFTISGLCSGGHHLITSHIGCESNRTFLTLSSDTILQIKLNHFNELLNEIVIHGNQINHSTEISDALDQKVIEQSANKSIGQILDNIVGVSSINMGSNVSKPVIHGLYGNRIAIFNNGVAQTGQQWGIDHAPEIDPFVADHISVIKGASALQYQTNALNQVIIVEPGSFSDDPHLNSFINYFYDTNGKGHTVNARIEKNTKAISWRATSTFQKKGDHKTPDYLLNNTGNKQLNASIQLERNISSSILAKGYYSYFNNTLGILRGSHISNLTDLQNALQREIPFFTDSIFSYNLESPRQKVVHQLWKAEFKHILNNQKSLHYIYSGQHDKRQEFDIRRGDRSQQASLYISQFSHFGETSFLQVFNNDSEWKSGIQFQFIDNYNKPSTGVLPLIPNYYSYSPSIYSTLQKSLKNEDIIELGFRYDFKKYDVDRIDTKESKIVPESRTFNNLSTSIAYKKIWEHNRYIVMDAGFVQRAPAINELYSAGLHQGVSGIEEGNNNLVKETSFKISMENKWNFANHLYLQNILYLNFIKNYIFLEPQEDFRLTIRGAFPVFKYKQSNARLFGMDSKIVYELRPATKINLGFAFVNGQNNSENTPLIFIPPSEISAEIIHHFNPSSWFNNPSIKFAYKYVFKQNRVPLHQDFLDPPNGYGLLDLEVSANIPLAENQFSFAIIMQNTLNTQYRNYLNRLRYFADDEGRNITVRLSFELGH